VGYLYENQQKIIQEAHQILEENSFLDKCTIGFGTFLGAYRQKKLNTSLNDWDDIDFEILAKNFIDFKRNVLNKFIKKGYFLIHAHLVKTGDIGSLTIGKGNDRIDFQIIFENKNNKCYHFLWHGGPWPGVPYRGGVEMTKGFSKKYYYDIRQYELEGLLFFGPKDAESYLIDMYGEEWLTPCTSENEYKFWEDSPGIPWSSRYPHYRLIKGNDLKELLNVE